MIARFIWSAVASLVAKVIYEMARTWNTTRRNRIRLA
jgi:hypothetical protein